MTNQTMERAAIYVPGLTSRLKCPAAGRDLMRSIQSSFLKRLRIAGVPWVLIFFTFISASCYAESGTEVSGGISEFILTNVNNYSFRALIQGPDYSITLFDARSNLISKAVRISHDTLVVNYSPSGSVGSDAIFEATLAATPYPFNAPTALELVWVTLMGTKSVISKITSDNSPESPGIILSDLLLDQHLNWHDIKLTNVAYENEGADLVRQFTQYAPGNILMGQNELNSLGLATSLVAKLRKTEDGRYLAPLSGSASNGYPVSQFRATGNFDATGYPKKTTLKILGSPQREGLQQIVQQIDLDVTESNGTDGKIDFPAIPKWATVTDFRVSGMRGKPDAYVLKDAKQWPSFTSQMYKTLVERRHMGMPMGSEVSPPHQNVRVWAIILMALTIAAPIILICIQKFNRKQKFS